MSALSVLSLPGGLMNRPSPRLPMALLTPASSGGSMGGHAGQVSTADSLGLSLEPRPDKGRRGSNRYSAVAVPSQAVPTKGTRSATPSDAHSSSAKSGGSGAIDARPSGSVLYGPSGQSSPRDAARSSASVDDRVVAPEASSVSGLSSRKGAGSTKQSPARRARGRSE